jgi:hypothetical protein
VMEKKVTQRLEQLMDKHELLEIEKYVIKMNSRLDLFEKNLILINIFTKRLELIIENLLKVVTNDTR